MEKKESLCLLPFDVCEVVLYLTHLLDPIPLTHDHITVRHVYQVGGVFRRRGFFAVGGFFANGVGGFLGGEVARRVFVVLLLLRLCFVEVDLAFGILFL